MCGDKGRIMSAGEITQYTRAREKDRSTHTTVPRMKGFKGEVSQKLSRLFMFTKGSMWASTAYGRIWLKQGEVPHGRLDILQRLEILNMYKSRRSSIEILDLRTPIVELLKVPQGIWEVNLLRTWSHRDCIAGIELKFYVTFWSFDIDLGGLRYVYGISDTGFGGLRIVG